MIDSGRTKTELLKILKKPGTTILPFIECPAVNRESKSQDEKFMNATELFSIFTADIIKEEVIFIR